MTFTVYPNSFILEYSILDKDEFLSKMRALTEPETGEPIESCLFIGRVKRDSFVVRKKNDFRNFFRPHIEGRFEVEKFVLSVGVSLRVIIALMKKLYAVES